MTTLRHYFFAILALAVAASPASMARPCYCAAPEAKSGACCAEKATAPCSAAGHACCCSPTACADLAAESASNCGSGWLPGCCCTMSQPTQAPGERQQSTEREAPAAFPLPATALPKVIAREAATATRSPDELRPTRPSFSILFCVWRE